jgi:phenylacetate-CoA ligase
MSPSRWSRSRGASPDDVAALQTQRTLQNVYENLPVHRKEFDAAGVTPADFRRLVDLGKFPFATKQNLRANDPFGMVAVGSDRIERVHAFCGSTSKPTIAGYTRRDIDMAANLIIPSFQTVWVVAGDEMSANVYCQWPLGEREPRDER